MGEKRPKGIAQISKKSGCDGSGRGFLLRKNGPLISGKAKEAELAQPKTRKLPAGISLREWKRHNS